MEAGLSGQQRCDTIFIENKTRAEACDSCSGSLYDLHGQKGRQSGKNFEKVLWNVRKVEKNI